jgi:hypothetical protein
MSREFRGDRKSPHPQQVEELIHSNIDNMILDQPLDLAIEHLQTFLRTSKHEKLTLERGYGYGNNPAKITLKGVRSETQEEVDARLKSQKDSIISSRNLVFEEIAKLESKIQELKKKAVKEEQRLEEFSKM